MNYVSRNVVPYHKGFQKHQVCHIWRMVDRLLKMFKVFFRFANFAIMYTETLKSTSKSSRRQTHVNVEWHFSNQYLSLSTYLSVYLSVYLATSLYLLNSLYIHLPISLYLSICLSLYLSIYIPLSLSIYLSLYLSTYLSIFISVSIFLQSLNVFLFLFIYLSLSHIHVSRGPSHDETREKGGEREGTEDVCSNQIEEAN